MFLLLISTAALASPFLVCDPEPTAVGLSFEVRKGTTVIYSGLNQPDGSIKVDIKDIAVGAHTITARYVSYDPWGTNYSADSPPLDFVRQGPVNVLPKGFKLVR